MRLTDITLIFTDGMALRAHNLAKHFILLTYLVTYFLIHCLFRFCLSLCYLCFVSVSASVSLSFVLSPCLSVSVCLSLSVCLYQCVCVLGGRGSMINFWVPYRGQRILY